MDGSSEGGDLARLFIILALLFTSAFFSASEAAFLALSRTRVRHMREIGLFGARLLSALYRRRTVVLSVTLLTITFCNYTAERLATLLALELIGPQLGPIVALVVMTAIILVFCEVVPIHTGAHVPERMSRIAMLPVAVVALVLFPVVLVANGIARMALFIGGVRSRSTMPVVTEDHLKAMIVMGEEEGLLEAGKRRMLHGVLDFGDQTAAQVMTPRPDMVSVEAGQTLGEALQLGLDNHLSRLPVYEESPDNIKGILHLKDLLPYLVNDEMDREVRVAARSAYHVPESLPVDEVLRQLQQKHTMIALVKDEFGGTAGLVTVEDVLEEIVGQIADEYDVEEPEVQEVGPGEFLCDARVAVHELENHINVSLPTEEYDSLAGFVMDLADRIPEAGEMVLYGNIELWVEAVSGPRIEKIRIKVPPSPEYPLPERGGMNG